jgi:hypothetical protein
MDSISLDWNIVRQHHYSWIDLQNRRCIVKSYDPHILGFMGNRTLVVLN